MRAPLLLATQRCARLGSYWESRHSLAAPHAFSHILPTIRKNVKEGSAIKEPPPPSVKAPTEFIFHRPKFHSTSSSSSLYATFTGVLCNSRVLTGGSGIEAGID